MTERVRRTLVTGASGFVGSHLVDLLVAEAAPVRCLTRASSSTRWLPDSVERVAADPREGKALRDAIESADIVFHLAAATSSVNGEGYQAANVELTRAICAAMRDAAPQARLVLCSTLAAGGPASNGRPLTENDPPRPIGPYGVTKLEAERVVADSGLDHVTVRPPAVYGPRDRDILEVFRFARFGIVPTFAPAGQLLSLVHVRDLAQGLYLAALRGGAGELYYVADGPPHSWGEIVEAMGAAVERRLRLVRLPGAIGTLAAQASCTFARLSSAKPLLTPERVRNMAQPAWTCDDSKARREIGYAPAIGLREGMHSTADWYRTQGWM